MKRALLLLLLVANTALAGPLLDQCREAGDESNAAIAACMSTKLKATQHSFDRLYHAYLKQHGTDPQTRKLLIASQKSWNQHYRDEVALTERHHLHGSGQAIVSYDHQYLMLKNRLAELNDDNL